MAAKRKAEGKHDGAAVLYMVLAVVGFSLTAPVVSFGDGGESPFLFNASIKFGYILGQLAFLLKFYWPLLFSKKVWDLIWRNAFCLPILFVVIHNFEYTFYAWSTRFIDISVSTILFDTYPLFLIVLMGWLYRKEERYRKVTLGVLLFLVLGFIGFAFVVLSQSGGLGGLDKSTLYGLTAGLVLILIAISMAVLSAFGLRWGTDLSKEMRKEMRKEMKTTPTPLSTTVTNRSATSLDLFFVMIAFLIGNAVAFLLSIGVGVVFTRETINPESIAIAIGGGFIALAVAEIAWRQSTLITSNLGVNALNYATPILSLMWLWMFSQIGDVRVDYLIIGTAAIIIANLIINFEAEIGKGFKSLIVALWACGTFVYLRDDLLNHIPSGAWVWVGESYFQALALSATVFTLLVSFRINRLATRTRDEDERVFQLFQNVDVLARRGLIDSSIRGHIMAIDSAQSPEQLQGAYNQASECFAQAAADVLLDPMDQTRLAEANAQLNALTHSRQQGIEFGELFALIIFGGVTVGLALMTRPAILGWTGFLIEMFTLLFSSVIIFLIVTMWDLQRDRTAQIIHKLAASQNYGVVFRDAKNRRFEQTLSIVTGLSIAVAFAFLMWNKWLHID